MTETKRKTPDTLANMRSLARGFTDASIKVLGGYVTGEQTEPNIRISAARELLDRGWGKPNQPTETKLDGKVEIILRDIAVEIRKKQK
jgi:hypothetical protein